MVDNCRPIRAGENIDTLSEADYIIFHEEQQFREHWYWVIGTIAMAILEIVLLAILILAFFFPELFGESHPPDIWALMIISSCMILILLFIILMHTTKLTTEVRSTGLYVRFFPFHISFKKIPLENLVRHEARTYRPIMEYGGWGIRYGIQGKAYNVSGNQGVQLYFSGGTKLLIGSQRSRELADAIRAVLPRK